MKTLIKKIVIIQAFVLFSFISFTQTYITLANNIITGGTTSWTDPWYIVQVPVFITSTGTLEINAGTLIQIDQNCYFDVQGVLQASGTSNNRITFTATNSNAGWQGIDISNNANTNVFNYCIFEYVKKTSGNCNYNFLESGAVYLNSSDFTYFNNCMFRYNEVCSGGGIAFISSYAYVSNCQFYNNTASNEGGGIYISDVVNSQYGYPSTIEYCDIYFNYANYGGGIYMENCVNDISINNNHLIWNNASNGAGCYFLDITGGIDKPKFIYNQLENNTATSMGGGMYFENSTFDHVTNNIIRQNESNDGGGIYIEESEINSLKSNLYEGNIANYNGGGLFIKKCNINLKLETIINNNAYNYGGGVYNEDLPTSGIVTFINCLIIGNSADYNGGGIYSIYDPYQQQQTNLVQYNNTISDNYARYGSGGGIYHENCFSTTVNTIIWGNRAAYPSYNEAFPDPNGTQGYSYSCTQPITNCATCTSNDPMFIGNGSYMISYGSSCYNIGNNSVQHENYDFDGNNRICHSTIDIGAYEDPYIYRSGNICQDIWTDHNPNGIDYIITDDITIILDCNLTIESGTTIAFYSSKRITVYGALTALGNSSNYITFTAYDPNVGWLGIDIETSINISVFNYCIFEKVLKTQYCVNNFDFDCNGTVYLKQANTTYFNYCIFRNNIVYKHGGGIAFIESQANVSNCYFLNNTALYKKGGGILIKGSSGNFNHQINNCNFNSNIACGGGGGIDLSNAGNVEINNSTFLYNISEGNSGSQRGGGAISIVSMGSGSINVVTVNGGNISYNSANNTSNGNGGGIFAYRSIDATLDLTIKSVKIQNNTASNNGGGIYLYGVTNPNSNAIYNNLITDNEASGNGGGIYMESSSNPLIYNCTIAENTATSGAGIYALSNTCNPYINNTIVYDNSPDQVDYYGADAADGIMYEYCNIHDFTGFPTNHYNIDAPPLWVGVNDYHLKYGLVSPYSQSPCINTGDPSFTPPGSSPYYDLDGNARIADGRIDMGCYENDGTNQNWWIVTNNINEVISSAFLIKAYPNPVDDLLNLNISSENNEKINIQLFNSLGKTVYDNSVFITKGENFSSIDMQQLSSGIYFLKVTDSSQDSKIMKVLLK